MITASITITITVMITARTTATTMTALFVLSLCDNDVASSVVVGSTAVETRNRTLTTDVLILTRILIVAEKT